MMMKANWFMQLVDSSAFEQPNEIHQAIRNWLLGEDGSMIERHIVWGDDSPYPTTISFSGVYAPEFDKLLEDIQPYLTDTEYMVFGFVGDGTAHKHAMQLYVVTKTMTAVMAGPEMIHELVRQLHTAAAPASGGAC